MENSITEIADRIRRLEVQGARNVAIAAVEAIELLAENTKSSARKDFIKELHETRDTLFATRETEPLMRNAIRWIINRVEDSDERRVSVLASLVIRSSKNFQKKLDISREKIAEIAGKRIHDGHVIFTHCRSSTVTYLLTKAKKEGKSFEVMCTETRPAFQGRKTAKELLEAGIKTTFIVDSATRTFLHDVDLVLVGADAITSEGNVVNKIGSSTIGLVAKEARIPFYVVSELLKFDPATLCGEYEKIEERSRNEIWAEAPKELNIRNPAFDVTPRDFIHGIICEEGIISPHSVAEVIHRVYPWIFY